jgi:cyanophycinase-like exopeptidase
MVEARYSRRETMSGMAAAGAAFMGAGLLRACDSDASDVPT